MSKHHRRSSLTRLFLSPIILLQGVVTLQANELLQEVENLATSILFAPAGTQQEWILERELEILTEDVIPLDQSKPPIGTKIPILTNLNLAIESPLRWRVWKSMNNAGSPVDSDDQLQLTLIATGTGIVVEVQPGWGEVGGRRFDRLAIGFTTMETLCRELSWRPEAWLIENMKFLKPTSDFDPSAQHLSLDYDGRGSVEIHLSEDRKRIQRMTASFQEGCLSEWTCREDRVEMVRYTEGQVNDHILATLKESRKLDQLNTFFDYRFDDDPRFVAAHVSIAGTNQNLDQRKAAGKWLSSLRLP